MDDLSSLRGEFLKSLLGFRGMYNHLKDEHLAQFKQHKKRTLRCLLLGCSPMGPCYFWPLCETCPGRCKRCRNPVMPKMEIRKN